jgi:hypothetical protein
MIDSLPEISIVISDNVRQQFPYLTASCDFLSPRFLGCILRPGQKCLATTKETYTCGLVDRAIIDELTPTEYPSCADCPVYREQQGLIEDFPYAVKGNGYRDIRCVRWEKRPGIWGACHRINELGSNNKPLDGNGNTPHSCNDISDICYRCVTTITSR